jgi:hypothetical protein
MDNQIDDTSKVMTCSGAVLKTSSSNIFNPLGRDAQTLDEFGRLTKNTNFETYYFSDIRTAFNHDITSITCTDQFRTCVTLSDDAKYCFGNADDTFILMPWGSFGLGLAIGVVSFGIFAAIMNYFFKRKWATFLVAMLTLCGAGITFPIVWYVSIWGYFGGMLIGAVPFAIVWAILGKGAIMPAAHITTYSKVMNEF